MCKGVPWSFAPNRNQQHELQIVELGVVPSWYKERQSNSLMYSNKYQHPCSFDIFRHIFDHSELSYQASQYIMLIWTWIWMLDLVCYWWQACCPLVVLVEQSSHLECISWSNADCVKYSRCSIITQTRVDNSVKNKRINKMVIICSLSNLWHGEKSLAWEG